MEKPVFRFKVLQIITLFIFISSILFIVGCGEDKNQYDSEGNSNQNAGKSTEANESGLTDFELKNGIGPIKEIIELSAIDAALVKKGEEIFNSKCAACHKLDERYVGPAQRDLLQRRSPEYIMNMMLNPEEMYKNHPEAKKLFTEYLTPMPNQNLSVEDARAVLEFFRDVNK